MPDSGKANSLIRWSVWAGWLRWQGNQLRRILEAKKSAAGRR